MRTIRAALEHIRMNTPEEGRHTPAVLVGTSMGTLATAGVAADIMGDTSMRGKADAGDVDLVTRIRELAEIRRLILYAPSLGSMDLLRLQCASLGSEIRMDIVYHPYDDLCKASRTTALWLGKNIRVGKVERQVGQCGADCGQPASTRGRSLRNKQARHLRVLQSALV